MKIDELAYKTVFKKRRLIPVAVQDYATREVLMVAYADAKAVKETVRTGFAHYWSRSRQELWKKGQTSGNVQRIIEILVDCDGDALLYRVEQTGTACTLEKEVAFTVASRNPRVPEGSLRQPRSSRSFKRIREVESLNESGVGAG